MPDPRTRARARADKRKGESASTQAGEFVREEIHHVREGKHGARSPQQAIAIGLSKARRAGVDLPAPRKGSSSVRRRAKRDLARGRKKGRRRSRTRSRATERALEREGHHSASREALTRQGRRSAGRRTHAQRSASARKAARTRARRSS
jgi:hypothetical protein